MSAHLRRCDSGAALVNRARSRRRKISIARATLLRALRDTLRIANRSLSKTNKEMNMLKNKNLGVAKLALTAVAFAACERIKPTLKDVILGAIIPGVGVTKAALYAACKGIANSGYLVDLMYGNCCKAHDACYTRGGDLSCKNKCDLDFFSCTRGGLSSQLGGAPIAEAVVAAATAGGFGTFNFNDNTCR
jgi:hypothetical protein